MNTSLLRFLADESCDFAVVRALRADGYDVLAICEVAQRSDNRELIDQAGRENCILPTEDKDFRRLVFVGHAHSASVILIRFPSTIRQALAQTVRQIVQEQGEQLRGAFVVVQPGYIRISRKTDAGD